MADRKAPRKAPAQAPEEHADARATDVLEEFADRRAVGDRLAKRIGARRFERARVVSSASSAIFDRCHVADPFDPESKERPIRLGPVGIENKRTVAPHASPPRRGEREAKTPAEQFNPRGIPDASTTRSGRPQTPVDPLRAHRPPPNEATARKQEIPQAGRDRLPPTSREEAEALIARSRAGITPVRRPAPEPTGEGEDAAPRPEKRARPTAASAPIVRDVPADTPQADAAPPPDEPAPPIPRRRKPMDLDDLFGGAAHVAVEAERPKRVRPSVPGQNTEDE